MAVGCGVDQLTGNPDPVGRLADAAFQHVTHPEFAADLPDIDRFALVGEAGIARDNEQRLEARQRGDDVFRHTVGEIFLLGVAAHVLKRQHGDGRLVGQREHRWRFRDRSGFAWIFAWFLPAWSHLPYFKRRRSDPQPPCPHRLGDILQRLLTHVVESEVDLAANLTLRVVGNADRAGLRDPLEASRDIDAVAENVVVIDDDVADMNADPEVDPRWLRHAAILFCHAMLNFDRAADRIDRAGEFDQYAVTGGLDDTPAMFGNGRIDDRFADCLEPGQRAFFAGPHQPAIANDISRQHGSQPPLHPLVCQDRPLVDSLSPVDLTTSDRARAESRKRPRWEPCADRATFQIGPK